MKNQNHKQRIFIVEDDTDLSEMLVAYFQVQGYDVENALRGEDAVAAITAVPPDVVVLDIRLPDIDGYEVCRRIRKVRRTPSNWMWSRPPACETSITGFGGLRSRVPFTYTITGVLGGTGSRVRQQG